MSDDLYPFEIEEEEEDEDEVSWSDLFDDFMSRNRCLEEGDLI